MFQILLQPRTKAVNALLSRRSTDTSLVNVCLLINPETKNKMPAKLNNMGYCTNSNINPAANGPRIVDNCSHICALACTLGISAAAKLFFSVISSVTCACDDKKPTQPP